MSTEREAPRLLAIDDSALIHQLLRVRLRRERLEIHSASTGREGVELARSLQPEAILLDISLGDTDGYSVLRLLKADARTHDIPVIFLSGNTDTDQKVRGLEMGAIDFITKPFDMAELTARVRSAVQIRQLIKMLAERAKLDAMTGLWNRAYFDERLEQAVAEALRHETHLALIFCDIDRFKLINDKHGHAFGDHVLREFATLLSSGRAGDIACRYGGEEFVVILPRASAEEAAQVAHRTRESLIDTDWDDHPKLRITASFGVSDLSRLEHPTAEELICSADRALYAAKSMGRDEVCIAPEPEQKLKASA